MICIQIKGDLRKKQITMQKQKIPRNRKPPRAKSLRVMPEIYQQVKGLRDELMAQLELEAAKERLEKLKSADNPQAAQVQD